MKQVKQSMPTANIAINKSRIKVYDKKSDVPTYYLKKGQEFQIELFNPTTDIILAKISLNNKAIAQGGLVLKPGQRVFLERYIDVERKFKFDTYNVANTAEVKEAIKENGDFKVEFYRQQEVRPLLHLNTSPTWRTNYPVYGSNTTTGGYARGLTTTSFNASNTTNIAASGSDITLDSLDLSDVPVAAGAASAGGQSAKKKTRSKKSKSIETGRVEMGSQSSQKLETVHYDFERWAFHTVTYKMLPVSQKVNTVKDTKVVRYCVECGNKQKPNNKFCPNCGTRL